MRLSFVWTYVFAIFPDVREIAIVIIFGASKICMFLSRSSMQYLEFSSILGNFLDYYGVCWTIWISESLEMHLPQFSMNCPECSGLFIIFWLMLLAFSQSFKTKSFSHIFWIVLKVEHSSETIRECFEFILQFLLTVLTIPWHLRSPQQSGFLKHILECIMFPRVY